MKTIRAIVVLFALVSLFATSVVAATFVVPPDEWMIEDAPAIVTGTIVSAFVRYDEHGEIETVHTLAVEEVLKGAISSPSIEVVEYGGSIGGRWAAVSGGPRYVMGGRYLIFLNRDRDNDWTTHQLTLGRFEFVTRAEGELLVRDVEEVAGWDVDGNPIDEPVRIARKFVDFVREEVSGLLPEKEYFANSTSSSRRTRPARPSRPITISTNLDFVSASNVGADKWTDHDGSDEVTDSISGSAATKDCKDVFDGQDVIFEDDPCGQISGTFNGSGTVATAFYGGGGSHSFDGDTYTTICCADVVTQDGLSMDNFSQVNFNTTMVHEIGHTFGFRHSDQGTPSSSNAIMNSSVVNGLNGNLQSWDIDAIENVYGDAPTPLDGPDYVSTLGDFPGRRPGSNSISWRLKEAVAPPCTGPSISSHPSSKTIVQGTSTTLSVSASASSGALSYQWYRGTSGDTGDPVGSDSSTLNTGTLNTTTSFWVRVTDECGEGDNTEDSNTATVTTVCNPTITNQPDDKSIAVGNSTTLSVTAQNATTYQWYNATSGVESNPVGSNSSSYNTGVLALGDHDYWVKVSNSCGSAESVTATVTVEECNSPVIDVDPASTTVTTGTSATLTVTLASGTGPFTYRWYEAISPTKSGLRRQETTSSLTDSFTSAMLTANTNFWVEVSHACSSAKDNSATAVITVTSGCVAPTISVQPQDTTHEVGGAFAILSVTASGTSPTYQWYQGESGDTSNPLVGAVSSSVGLGPAATTKYWVRVSNACGTVDSVAATVTVTGGCDPVAIVVHPSSFTIKRGSTITLEVFATGSPVSYQWYEGPTGNASKPIEGATSNSYTTPALTKTTQYWVRVFNQCSAKASTTATVNVEVGRRRGVRRR